MEHRIFDVATTGSEAVMVPLESAQGPGFCGGSLTGWDLQVIIGDVAVEAAVPEFE